MNEIVNKILLAGETFMTEMHLKQPGFTYSACRPFTKNKEEIQKFKETRNPRHFYQSKLDKACFQCYMAHGVFKVLTRRATFEKILRDQAFNIAKCPNNEGYQSGLALMVYKLFNKELPEELHKPIIKKFEKLKVHSPFIDIVLGAHLSDMQLISKTNKGTCFSSYIFYQIFSKYAWVFPLKDKKVSQLLMLFKKS